MEKAHLLPSAAGDLTCASNSTGSAGESRFIFSKDPNLSLRFLRLKTGSLGHVPEEPGILRIRLLWARNGIYWALKALGIGPEDEVLAPAYICRAALDPVEHLGSRVILYKVTGECRADLVDLRARISPRVKAVIAVHYFGFPERIREIREICNAFGLVLIEDCAHVLTGMTDGGRLGSFGDASVFSWRKVLPVYDGADLIIRAPVVNPLPPMVRQPLYLELRTVFNLISRAATQERSSVFLRKCMQLAGWVASRRPRLKSENAIHPEMSAVDFSSSLLGLPMSTVSTQLLQHSDLARIALQRRNNYCYLARCLAGIPRVRLLYPELPERICPWILPLVFEGMTGAHLTLRRRGIPAVTWGEVRPRQLRDGDFPEAQHLYDNLVFLPIHQDLTLSDMERISREAGKITALNA